MMRSVAVWVLIACALFVSGPVRAQTPPLIPLEVGLGDVSLTKLIFLVAYDAGVYTKDGLDVHQYITPRAAEVVRRSGVIVPPQFIRTSTGNDVPITIEGGSPRLVEMTTSALAPDRVIIATTDNTARFHIISRSDITSPEQLKGKRLGYTEFGAITQLMAIAWAQKMGWKPDRDISLLADGTAFDVLKSGREDAFVGDEITQAMAAQLGYRDLVDLSTYHIPLAGSGVNASRSWLRDHHDVAARFIKATVDAIALVKTNKAVAFASLAKWYGITDPCAARTDVRAGRRSAAQAVLLRRRHQRSDGDLSLPRNAHPQTGRLLRRELRPRPRPKRLHRLAL
jgi:NitT/TauT family transport system substrate-binding protein